MALLKKKKQTGVGGGQGVDQSSKSQNTGKVDVIGNYRSAVRTEQSAAP